MRIKTVVINFRLKVDKRSSDQVQRKLKQLQDDVSGTASGGIRLTFAHLRISQVLLTWVNKNFQSEGGKVGGWKPLKLGGRWVGKGKNRKFDADASILTDTAVLKGSFAPFADKKRAGIGSDLEYSYPHEVGLPHRNLPSRRMLPEELDDELNKKIIKIYDMHIEQAIKRRV